MAGDDLASMEGGERRLLNIRNVCLMNPDYDLEDFKTIDVPLLEKCGFGSAMELRFFDVDMSRELPSMLIEMMAHCSGLRTSTGLRPWVGTPTMFE